MELFYSHVNQVILRLNLYILANSLIQFGYTNNNSFNWLEILSDEVNIGVKILIIMVAENLGIQSHEFVNPDFWNRNQSRYFLVKLIFDD